MTDVFDENSESPSDREKYRRNKGCAQAVLIEAEYRESTSPPAKRAKSSNDNDKSV